MKAQLGSFRKGWESENLARFILYKFSFVAQPSTVADDIGSDFYCTLFETQEEGGHDYLIPRNAFAIQIKSDTKNLDVSNKLHFLENLEIPFFIGVANREDLILTFYSGEYLPAFFSHKGIPECLQIKLCDRAELHNLDDYIVNPGSDNYILKFPKVIEIKANIEYDELRESVKILHKFCVLMQENISSRISKEYSFRIPGRDLKTVYLTGLAGSDSVQYFQRNFLRRLSEVLFNLEWKYRNAPSTFSWEEFSIYENLIFALRGLEDIYGQSPEYEYLLGRFESLSNTLKKNQ